MSKPIAVMITDVHYRIDTIPLASEAVLNAAYAAQSLGVPLLVLGDLNDTKAVMRAECINAMIDVFSVIRTRKISSFVLVGNHDKINERSEEHTLNFLKPYTDVVDTPRFNRSLGLLLPYQHDTERFKEALTLAEPGTRIFMHQGVHGANMGEYALDKSAVDVQLFDQYAAFSGHYHPRHSIGNVTYIGNPYTVSFAEAGDGPKGYSILYSDNTVKLIPIRLRKHVVYAFTLPDVKPIDLSVDDVNANDLVSVKLHGTDEQLAAIDKVEFGKKYLHRSEYKLEKISSSESAHELQIETKDTSQAEVFDAILDAAVTGELKQSHLKKLWRTLV